MDAAHIIQHIDNEKPKGVENEAVEQIAFAGRVLLNKCDLVDGEVQLVEVVKRIRRTVEGFRIIIGNAECDMPELLKIPDNFKVMLLQGDATTQFASVALNLLGLAKKGPSRRWETTSSQGLGPKRPQSRERSTAQATL